MRKDFRKENNLGLLALSLALGGYGQIQYRETKFNLRNTNDQEALDSADRKIAAARERNRLERNQKANEKYF